MDLERWRLLHEPLVDEHLEILRMVNRHQRDVIHEVRFPQLRGDPHVVRSVARHELIGANLHPVFGLRHAGGVLRVDAQPER